VLLAGFALPGGDLKRMENILDLVTNFDLGAITDEPVGSATHADNVLKSIDKLLLRFHPFNVSNERISTNKKLGHGFTTTDGGGIGKHSVLGNSLLR
jgi:hypothetical protein